MGPNMIIVYIVLLLILVYVNYRLVNRLLYENRIYVVHFDSNNYYCYKLYPCIRINSRTHAFCCASNGFNVSPVNLVSR